MEATKFGIPVKARHPAINKPVVALIDKPLSCFNETSNLLKRS